MCDNAIDTAQHPPSLLERTNPLPSDGMIEFDPGPHTYTWKTNGLCQTVKTSVTKMLKNYWPEFDNVQIIKDNFDNWRAQKNGKYAALIQYLMLVEGRDETYCKEAIAKLWHANGISSATAGTAMHADFQAIVEQWPISHETPETQMFKHWLNEFCKENNCAPFRSEWLIHLSDNETSIVAGQVDLVLKHREKDLFIGIDYKRTDPTPKYHRGPRNLLHPTQKNISGETGLGPFANLEATEFNKYSAQLNAYGYIAATNYGIDFRDRMLLVQVHPNLTSVHAVRVPRLDDEMNALFGIEIFNAKQNATGTTF